MHTVCSAPRFQCSWALPATPRIYSALEFELSLGSVRSGPLYYCQIVHDSPPPNSATVYGVVTYPHLQNLGFRVWGCWFQCTLQVHSTLQLFLKPFQVVTIWQNNITRIVRERDFSATNDKQIEWDNPWDVLLWCRQYCFKHKLLGIVRKFGLWACFWKLMLSSYKIMG